VKWKNEYFRDPENAFRGNGKAYKEQAKEYMVKEEKAGSGSEPIKVNFHGLCMI